MATACPLGASPADICDLLHVIVLVAGRERIEAAERLLLAKLGRLVDHHPARRHSAVTPSVKQHRARDYPKHLVTRQERIVTLDLHLAGVGVISDELEAGAVGVEHLAAASDEPGFVGLDRTHRVGEPDIGGRSEEHTSELQSLMRISYAVFCLKNKKRQKK